jgi:glyoxylase I family protein
MPSFSKISHVSFSVRDKDASAKWWQEVLELNDLDRTSGEDWSAVLLIHPASATVIEFQQHTNNAGETFDPVRTGFDHLGFKVDTREELEDWQRRFERMGVRHTPVVDREYGSVLTFKDPDGIQFEMFYRANHP